MAYDGSLYAKKSIDIAVKNPIFPNTKRYIVNVNSDKNDSNRVLNEASLIFKNANIDSEILSLSGGPDKETDGEGKSVHHEPVLSRFKQPDQHRGEEDHQRFHR